MDWMTGVRFPPRTSLYATTVPIISLLYYAYQTQRSERESTIHLHLVRFITHGALPPLPHTSSWRQDFTFYGEAHLNNFTNSVLTAKHTHCICVTKISRVMFKEKLFISLNTFLTKNGRFMRSPWRQPPPLRLVNKMTDFHEIRCKRYAILGHPNLILFNFL